MKVLLLLSLCVLFSCGEVQEKQEVSVKPNFPNVESIQTLEDLRMAGQAIVHYEGSLQSFISLGGPLGEYSVSLRYIGSDERIDYYKVIKLKGIKQLKLGQFIEFKGKELVIVDDGEFKMILRDKASEFIL